MASIREVRAGMRIQFFIHGIFTPVHSIQGLVTFINEYSILVRVAENNVISFPIERIFNITVL